MPQVQYVVDRVEGQWVVLLGEKRFGPYSSLDAAAVAAMGAARKAEAQGFEVTVVFASTETEAEAEADRAEDRDAA